MITIHKKRGETPLECLNRLRAEHEDLKNEKLSYAGRLDPMAEGLLLVLVGSEENKKREQYLALDKEYTCDVLFGFATDTYDLCGKLTAAPDKRANTGVSFQKLLQTLDAFRGTFTQAYPPYSSKTVGGKPLHVWAREGKIGDVAIPEQDITIHRMALTGMQKVSTEALWKDIDEGLALLSDDFRQKEIRDCWWEHLRVLYGENFDIATLAVQCSSGTYVRSIAHNIGQRLGIPALASRIIRTRMGKYALE